MMIWDVACQFVVEHAVEKKSQYEKSKTTLGNRHFFITDKTNLKHHINFYEMEMFNAQNFQIT